MNRWSALLIAALAAWCSTATLAALPGPVQRELRRAGIPAEALAIEVREVGAARPLLQHRAKAPMNPASTMKLLTTYAALELLGPAHTWKTSAYHTGEIHQGVLTGDLYVQGSGDPKITYEAFASFLHQLRANGLEHIRGDLVLDRARFALPPHNPAAFDNEPLKAYNVGPDALLFNFKTVRFIFVPDAAHKTVLVRAEPHPQGLTIASDLKLGDQACNDWRASIQPQFESESDRAHATFTGTYPLACAEKSWWVSLFDHAPFFAGSFRAMWTEQGGSLSGGWREDRVPSGARLLGQLESPPLAELIRDINKRSNNVMARQLFMQLAAREATSAATLPAAQASLAAWLRDKGLRFPELAIENGSGLARGDRISAEHLTEVLQRAYVSPVMPEFVASLPVLATDGTLEHRMRGRVAAGMAHLKTGSLDEVRALAGYLLDHRGRRYVLVAIVNHPQAATAQPALEALVDWVVRQGAGRKAKRRH